MKKILKISLIVLVSLLVLVGLGALGTWQYAKSTFLDFESDYKEKRSFSTLSENGYSYTDRNGNTKLDVYEDDRRSMDDRVKDVLAQMNTEEKIHLLKGSGLASALGRQEPGEGIPGVVGTIVATPRLGLPSINLSDGPAGLRIQPERPGEDRTFYCTAFPIGTQLASSWNQSLAYEVGDAMGLEALEYGIDVILGPAINIHRHPFCGRNFEYFSEDPYLTGHIGASVVNGIEKNGVGTSIKHFVANNQETNRNNNSSELSQRALREIYLKSFEIIVKEAQPWTIMSSYNKVNGTYVAERKDLLTDILRGEWGFEGLVMSDWFGGNDAVAMVRAGNDLLEPGTKKQWKALTEGYENGTLSEEEIDLAAGRIIKLILGSRKMQNYKYSETPDLRTNARIARNAASEGMVLLKNESGVLPLSTAQSIALLGVTSFDFISGGTGSGDVNEAYTVSLEQGLVNAGFNLEASARQAFDDHKLANAEAFVKTEGLMAMASPYDPPEMNYTEEQIKSFASTSDIGIITIGRNSGEGGDRKEKDDFLLSVNEQEMISKSAAAFHEQGKKLIVVLNIGGVVETASWADQVDGILLAWQGGQEAGNAVADILSGAANPSGKLPMTFPVQLNDHASNANFPKETEAYNPIMLMLDKTEKPKEEQIRDIDYTLYEEGIYVGYRHFDKAQLEVAYPFGFGLSYTNFDYTNMQTSINEDRIELSVSIKNAGELAGKEVVQIYFSKKDSQEDRALKELVAFAKTPLLEVDSSVELLFSIPLDELKYWDEGQSAWVLETGEYEIHAAASSRDILLSNSIIIE